MTHIGPNVKAVKSQEHNEDDDYDGDGDVSCLLVIEGAEVAPVANTKLSEVILVSTFDLFTLFNILHILIDALCK